MTVYLKYKGRPIYNEDDIDEFYNYHILEIEIVPKDKALCEQAGYIAKQFSNLCDFRLSNDMKAYPHLEALYYQLFDIRDSRELRILTLQWADKIQDDLQCDPYGYLDLQVTEYHKLPPNSDLSSIDRAKELVLEFLKSDNPDHHCGRTKDGEVYGYGEEVDNLGPAINSYLIAQGRWP
jgi:hypothetical protein